MSRKTIGVLLLLGASEVVGLLLGQWFFGLFLRTVPPLAVSSFNMGAAHIAFLLYGAVAGIAVFAIALAAAASSRFFAEPPSPG